MSVKISYPNGYVDPYRFIQIKVDFYRYHSPLTDIKYDIHYNKSTKRWTCNCPDETYRQKQQDGRCKHEVELNRLLQERRENRSKAEKQADTVVVEVEIADLQDEVTELRQQATEQAAALAECSKGIEALLQLHEADLAEIAALRSELAEARQAQQQPDLSAILAEVAALREENAQIKRELKTKATARKRHMLEEEAAAVKKQVNSALDEIVTQAESAIQAAKIARDTIKELETYPHLLKEQLDKLTEQGVPELQPDYQAPDHVAPEIHAAVREVKQQAHERSHKREDTPLGKSGFSVLKQ